MRKVNIYQLTVLGTWLLSTHADRQGVDISFTVYFVCLCLSVCTAKDFSAKDKANGIKLVRRFIGVQGRESNIFVNFAPPEAQNGTNRRARGPRPPAASGSACVDKRQYLLLDRHDLYGKVVMIVLATAEDHGGGSREVMLPVLNGRGKGSKARISTATKFHSYHKFSMKNFP